jgi:hypothetical protein
MTVPFGYPTAPRGRRHGPSGYADYDSYRAWLRDEFLFRCVFCLRRETWSGVLGEFAIDHFEPVVLRPDRATEYDNLLYVCGPCNVRKAGEQVPDPLTTLLADAVIVRPDGTIEARTRAARRIVRGLRLDGPGLTEFRALWIEVIGLAAQNDLDLYGRLLGFPAELPDLRRLRPPGGNTRPEGIEQSYFRRRERGELPATY